MKRQFFDTSFAQFAGLDKQIPRVLKYTVESRNDILPTSELMTMAQAIRNILKTPIAEFFDRLVAAEKLSNFAAIYVPKTMGSLPELLTSSNITLDLKQISDTSTIRAVPELRDKVLINLTSVLRQDKSYGGFYVNAVDVFQNLFVRGHLVASYEDSDGWLTPFLGEYAVRSYSMILSGIISRYYSLSLTETLKVTGILALFMCQMLSRESDNLVLPPLFNRCTHVGNRGELQLLAESCEHKSKFGLTLDTMVALIAELGPERMAKFDVSAFKSLCGGLGPDLITSAISLEYPPYWVHMLLMALSGTKLPLIYQLNSHRLTADGRSKFLQQLLTADSLFSVDRR